MTIVEEVEMLARDAHNLTCRIIAARARMEIEETGTRAMASAELSASIVTANLNEWLSN